VLLEEPLGRPRVITQQTEQDVLVPDVAVAEFLGRIERGDQHAPRRRGEPIHHRPHRPRKRSPCL
jgi:hypothetical protein